MHDWLFLGTSPPLVPPAVRALLLPSGSTKGDRWTTSPVSPIRLLSDVGCARRFLAARAANNGECKPLEWRWRWRL